MNSYVNYINGSWVDSVSKHTRTLINPADGSIVARVAESSSADAEAAILAARAAFDHGPWKTSSASERARFLFRVAEAIRKEAAHFAKLEVQNCGKPLAEAEFDVADAASCFEFYAGLATKIHGETMSVPAASMSYVVREPIGVCAQIIPWNFPLLMAAWKIAPALAAGNTLVIKPSELTPVTACELFKLFHALELPAGVANLITGPGVGAGEALAESPLVDKIAFTGGTSTGQKVMRSAAGNIKKLSLELGGKNPNVVFADAPFEAAVDGALFGAFANQGEVCSAGSRLLVEKSIHEKFVVALLEKIPRIVLGNGLTAGTKMGPLISAPHRDKVESYVELGKAQGAVLLCGGKRPEGPLFARGHFYEPTVFDAVTPAMRVFREEIFGPVLTVTTFESEDEALRLANDTDYGLAAGVWTSSIARAHRMVKGIRAGITWVNTYHPTYNELPWGGYKQSGMGRELGLHGIEGYLETKQINFNLDENPIGWY